MTTHALVTIEQNAPAAMPAKSVELKAGHINVGAELVEVFSDQNQESTKVEKIAAWAGVLTTAEFSDAIKKAKDIVDTIDSANGFKKAEGAKGQDAYGPRRQLLNARMSEAKRIFGVFKQAPQILKEKGYWAAVNLSRQWLEINGKTWDGNKAQSKEEKAQARNTKLESAAMTATMLANPQEMGETRADYLQRIDAKMAQTIAAAKADSFDKRVDTIVASLNKQFGDEPDALMEACTRILSAGGTVNAPESDSPEETTT